MKVVFLECSTARKTDLEAHVRQCRFLCNYLTEQGHEAEILFSDTMHKEKRTNIDVIVVSYGSFYANTAEMTRIIETNPQARLYWLSNEYDLRPNGDVLKVLRKRGFKIIANIEKRFFKYAPQIVLNLNLLFYSSKQEQEKKFPICYFGTYRKDRANYFKKYINSPDFILSTSSKNFKKFKFVGCNFRPAKKFVWGRERDTLGQFAYSLYIEDEFTHTHYNHLADRFYEALSNQTVTLFDVSCINTLKRSEIANLDFEAFLINGIVDVKNRNYQKDWAKQREWIPHIEKLRCEMLKNFLDAISN